MNTTTPINTTYPYLTAGAMVLVDGCEQHLVDTVDRSNADMVRFYSLTTREWIGLPTL